MTEVAVTICIPVYNGAEFISEAIESVLKQSFQDFEIIVLDNKSTDATLEVVKRFNDARITLLQNDTNLGMLGNWNKILGLAKGKYIKLLPADDAIYSTCLELQVAVLERDSKETISLVCARKDVVNEKGKILFSRGFSRSTGEVQGIKAININTRSGGNIIGEPGVVLFRRSILEKTGLFDASNYYAIDIDLWYKMLLHGNLYVIAKSLCIFRISGASESPKIINRQKNDLHAFMKKTKAIGAYHISSYSYYFGLVKVNLLTLAKRILYKLLVK